MGKDDKVSLIIMRDDGRVRSYRVRMSWFRFFLYVQAFLLLAAMAGLYGGFTSWVEKLELAQANTALQEDVVEMQIQLERLQNIEAILKTTDPEEIQALSSTVSREKHAPKPNDLDLREIFVTKDLRMAAVNNLLVRNSGEHLQVSFDLNNLTNKPLAGVTRIFYVSRDATVIQVQGEDSELRFEIQHFRKVTMRLPLPPGLGLEDIFGLRMVIVDSREESIFIQTYPLADVLTT